ncbi:TetR/AcrR family transcriptional regulator [Pontiella sulfatireligans]|nr:TetR/AcrR family transcriptional regulator [Pontiella sulfatireligans]
MKHTRITNSREKLLDAAETIVMERGATRMTLDAVAAQAKVSKGGLLYHFASKEALVQAMVARIVGLAEEHFAAALANESPGKGRHARALLYLMLDDNGPFLLRVKRMAAPLLAAVAGNADLLSPMRQFLQTVRQGMSDDGLSDDRAWLILASLDGIKFWRILHLLEPSGTDLAKVRCLLEQLIDSEDFYEK